MKTPSLHPVLGSAALIGTAVYLTAISGCSNTLDAPSTGASGAGPASGGTAGVSGSAPAGGAAGGGMSGAAGADLGGTSGAGTSGAGTSGAGTSGADAGGASGAGAGGLGGGGMGGANDSGAGGTAGGGTDGGGEGGMLATGGSGAYLRTGWTAVYSCTGGTCPPQSAADTGDVTLNAFDGNFQTRWSTGVFQSVLSNMNRFPLFFTVDMKQATNVSKITIHPGCKDYFDSPGTVEVFVSMDGVDFGSAVTSAPHVPQVPGNEPCPPNASSVATDVISFPTTRARFIQLKGTRRTTSDRYWAIGELNVYP